LLHSQPMGLKGLDLLCRNLIFTGHGENQVPASFVPLPAGKGERGMGDLLIFEMNRLLPDIT
ncbi:MAG: hypothetical protein AAGU05_13820, partial [Anaerolineaceae bacterium]